MASPETVTWLDVESRPQLPLIAIQRAAIPVAHLRVDVLEVRNPSIPVLEEYVLRLVAAGVTDLVRMSETLGVDIARLADAVARQLSVGNIYRGSSDTEILTTEDGVAAIRGLPAREPATRTVSAMYDETVRTVSAVPIGQTLTEREAREQGLHLIVGPMRAEITASDLAASEIPARRGWSIIRIRSMAQLEHRFRPVEFRIYGNGGVPQAIGLAIGTVVLAEHGRALGPDEADKALRFWSARRSTRLR